MARRFWTPDGRFRGETSYDAAIGSNSSITTYYFYGNDVTSLINGINFKGKWGGGVRRSGSDGEYVTTYNSLPARIKANSNQYGQPYPAVITPVNTMQSGTTTRPSSSALSLAGVTATSCYTRMLRSGMTGGDVLWIQQKLSLIGNFTGAFDSATVNAVKNFQSRTGLVADGIVGPKTACKLGMTCINCAGVAPAPSTGGGATGGGSTPVSTPAPVQQVQLPPPKPQPPYKLPIYQAPVSEIKIDNMIPISETDLTWANWEVFNAYELARVQHNEYFESIQPDYNVIPNIGYVIHNTDETDFLMDVGNDILFASPDIAQDLAVLAYGTAIPTTTEPNISNVYAAVNNDLATSETKRARLMGVKFLRSTTELKIGTGGPYLISYIKRRLDDNNIYGSVPITLTVTATQTNFQLTWSTTPYAEQYEIYDGSTLVATVGGSVKTWSSPTFAANTTKTYQIKGFRMVGDINTPTTKLYVATSNTASATIPAPVIGPTALAPLTKLNAQDGWVVARFGIPSPSTYFGYVYFTIKEGSMPSSLNDGKVMGPYYPGSANVDLYLHQVGTDPSVRGNDRTFFVQLWSFNTAGQQAPGSNNWSTFFLRNPVAVYPILADSWSTSYSARWEPPYNRIRCSNYGSSNKYTGFWFYADRLRNAVGGRNVYGMWIYVRRQDDGDGGPIPIYLGNHYADNRPPNTSEPPVYNVASTGGDMIARRQNKWFNIDRFNGMMTAGQITGFALYRKNGPVNDLHTFVGQADGAGNAYADDGLVHVYHRDFV